MKMKTIRPGVHLKVYDVEPPLILVYKLIAVKLYVIRIRFGFRSVWMRFNVLFCCRFSCDSPTSDLDTRTPKGRGKRGRAAAVAANEANCDRKLRKGRRANSGAFTAPPSPVKTEDIRGSKRKGRPADLHIDIDGPKASKRSRSNSRSTPTGGSSNNSQASPAAPSTPGELIECPEPNCNKKYKHINGLRYHQSHAHHLFVGEDEEPMDEKDDSSEESNPQSPRRYGGAS